MYAGLRILTLWRIRQVMRYLRRIEEMLSDTREKMIIDIRSEEDFMKGSFPGAVNFPDQEFDSHIEDLKKDIPIYLICYSGKLSLELCSALNPKGYEAYSILGGIHGCYLHFNKERLQDPEAAAVRRRNIERSIIKTYRSELWSRARYRRTRDGGFRPPFGGFSPCLLQSGSQTEKN